MASRTCSKCGQPGEFYAPNSTICKPCRREQAREYARRIRHGETTTRLLEECEFPGCLLPAYGHGYCRGHYHQIRRGRPLTPLVHKEARPGDCRIHGCRSSEFKSGLCRFHFAKSSEPRFCENCGGVVPRRRPLGKHVGRRRYLQMKFCSKDCRYPEIIPTKIPSSGRTVPVAPIRELVKARLKEHGRPWWTITGITERSYQRLLHRKQMTVESADYWCEALGLHFNEVFSEGDIQEPPDKVAPKEKAPTPPHLVQMAQAMIAEHGETLAAIPIDWRNDAICADIDDPEVFFPETGCSITAEAARAICGNCPAKLACAATAVRDHEVFGIWGGLNEPERRVVRAELSLTRDQHYRKGTKLSPSDKATIQELYEAGLSLRTIGERLGRNHKTVSHFIHNEEEAA